MRTSRLPLVLSLFALATTVSASDALIEPGLRLSVIDTPHLHALVPTSEAEQLRSLIAKADAWYVRIAKDADYEITRPLNLLLTDSVDTHNGYSFVTPYPLVNIQLAPALAQSGIFTGEPPFERTFIHEVTHHISNDRSYGTRRVLETIFGRILPMDLLSALTAYLSTPAHQTMPSFWHEGLAQWSETHYADPASPWAGRGRDSLTHMVWRLDTAAGAIPPPGNWHYTYHRWPFGTETYLYGIAYLRYLYGTYGDHPSPLRIAEAQAHQWAFEFDSGPEALLGKTHHELITEARAALEQEQQRNLAIIRSQPVTKTKRLTPDDWRVGAPCWMPDGRLFTALDDPCDQPRFGYVDASGHIGLTGDYAFALGGARSLPDGTIVYHEIPSAGDVYTHSRAYLQTVSGRHQIAGERLLQPDVRPRKTDQSAYAEWQLAGIHLLPGEGSELRITSTSIPISRWVSFISSATTNWTTIPTQDLPWSPTFRPGHDELSWVETDHHGSRLILAPLADPAKRTVLATIRGRIMQPSWSADGRQIFICADHSGVANAYRIDVDKPGELVPVTNTIGGIIACVPSFDGKELAVIDHDQHGPYLARIPNNPATWPKSVPTITLAWPDDQTPASAPGIVKYEPQTEPTATTVSSYHGVPEIRPLFWTPTTLPVPEGGYGVLGVAMDPAQTHQVIGSIGVGSYDHSPVGLLGWTYSGWPVDLALVGWQAERTYLEQLILANGQVQDFSESRASGEARVGYGLSGSVRRWQTWVAAGTALTREAYQSAERHDGIAILNSQLPFAGHEQYVEATLAYSAAMLFPTSYAREDGPTLAVSARHSGFNGDLDGDRLQATGSYVFSVIPTWGQQLVTGGAAGVSNGDRTMQGQFHAGGNTAYGLPRGYPSFVASGAYLLGGSVAWRTPLWQPFFGHSTTPLVSRQAVLELFYEGAKVSNDHINGDGLWYRSAGGEIRWSFSFWEQLLNPGFGLAHQVDGKQDNAGYFTLDWRW